MNISAEMGSVTGHVSLLGRNAIMWVEQRWGGLCHHCFFSSHGSFLSRFAPLPLFTCLPQGSLGNFSLVETFAHDSVLFSSTASGKSDLLLSAFSTKNRDPGNPAAGSSLPWILPPCVRCRCLCWKQRWDFPCKPINFTGCIRLRVFSLSCRHSAA